MADALDVNEAYDLQDFRNPRMAASLRWVPILWIMEAHRGGISTCLRLLVQAYKTTTCYMEFMMVAIPIRRLTDSMNYGSVINKNACKIKRHNRD